MTRNLTWLRCFLLTSFLLLAPGVSRAQSPDDRKLLQALHDSLNKVQDSTSLLALETRTITQAKTARDDAMIHLRLGLIALQLNKLGSRKHLDYAISEFEWALELQPEWPWPWLGIGLADRNTPNAGRYGGGLFTLLGLDAESKAGKAFAKSVEVDSSFAEGLLGLSDIALNERINAPVGSALDAMRSASKKSSNAELLIARARLERLAGYPDSALRVFNQARTSGGPADLLWLEIARTIPLATRSFVDDLKLPSTDSAYFSGAATDDSAVVAMYRSDLAPIVEDSALVEFDAVHGQARVDWLRKFWLTRDQLDLRSPGSRLVEHFKRWQIVRKEFPLSPYRRRYANGVETYRSGNRDVDDRGIVLLRHGYPTQRIVWPDSPRGPGDTLAKNLEVGTSGDTIRTGTSKFVRPAVNGNYGNESWIYKRPDGDVVLHFAANFDPQDFRLQATALGLDVSFYDILHTIYGGANMPSLRKLLESNGSTVDVNLAAEKVRAKHDNGTATTTDSWFREYPHVLPGRPGWFAVGATGGVPLVHLVYAIDAKAMLEEPWNQIPVTLRAVFLDSAGKVVATLDTLEMMNRPAHGVAGITVRAEIGLPPGAQRVRFGAEITPDKGAVYKTDTLRLPHVDGSRLDLSDILIGRRTNSLRWIASPGDTAWLDPQITYHTTDTLHVYAEAYGIHPSDIYSVRLTLTRQKGGLGKLLGGRTAAITLGENVVFKDATGRIRREVALGQLEPGDYQMELTVEGKNGKVTQHRRVYVVK